jgi:hypothetical protein
VGVSRGVFLNKLLLPLILLALASPAFAHTCDVRDYGAKGDGVTLDTPAIASAIAACVQQGGGTVYFSAGRYVIGTLQLQSHIHLYLDSGATLMGSHDLKQYLPSPPFGFARDYGVNITGEGNVLGMLIAKNADDVSIEGQGTIDGQAESFFHPEAHGGGDYLKENVRNGDKYEAAMSNLEYGPIETHGRPGTMIVFFHCTNVHLHGITLHQSPNWTLHLQDVEGADISDIQILNDQRIPNNDGIDCMQCRHVRISDCNIITGDDGFAIVASENVNVSNCSLSSRSAAIRLESTKLSTFTGLTMDTNRGIGIFASNNQNQEVIPTENVLFSDIAIRTRLIPGGWWGKAEPIYIAVQSCAPGTTCPNPRQERGLPQHHRRCRKRRAALGRRRHADRRRGDRRPAPAHAHPRAAVERSRRRQSRPALDPVSTPRFGMVKSEIPALYAKRIDGLRLRDVQVDWPTATTPALPDYYSDGIKIEDFKDLTIDDFEGRQAQMASGAAISLVNGTGVAVTNSRAMPGTRTFLQLDKVDGRRVFVNYDVKGAAKVIVPATLALRYADRRPCSGERNRPRQQQSPNRSEVRYGNCSCFGAMPNS